MGKMGGWRPGAGRPRGSKNKSTLERETVARELVVRQMAASNESIVQPPAEDIAKMTPLEIIMFAMVRAGVEGNWELAADLAAKAAPFRHAKLSNVTQETTIRRSVAEMTDDELSAFAGDDDSEGKGEGEG